MANTLVFTPDTLKEYVNVNRDELFVKSVLGGKTMDYVDIMPNVKYKEALHYLDSEIVLGDGSECGWNPDGSDTISERYVEVKPIEINKEFCWKDFRTTFANHQLKFEAGRETLPFEQKIAESNVNAIEDAVENVVWQGDETLGIDGFIAQAEAEGNKVQFAEGQTVADKVDAVVAALTARMLKKGVNIFLSITDFRNYVMEMNGTCCAGRPILDAASESIVYSGDSRIKLIPVVGLEGTGAIVAGTADALVAATDIEGSEGVYKWMYDEKEDKMLFKVLFNLGTVLRFPDEVVIGK